MKRAEIPDTAAKDVRRIRWDDNLSRLARFVADNGRLPTQRGADARELSLAYWLNTQRYGARPDRMEALDRLVPTWRKTQFDSAWERQMEDVASFKAANGFFPRSSSSDRDEQLLGYWLVEQRRNVTPARAAMFDARIPGWRESRNLPLLWQNSLEDLVRFVTEHGHNPRQTGKATGEKRLAFWLKDQRILATPERSDVLDKALPKWRGNHPGHRSWIDSFTAVKDFLADHGHLPSRGADPSQHRLRQWLTDQIQRATDDQLAALDQAFPGWTSSRSGVAGGLCQSGPDLGSSGTASCRAA